MHIHEYILQDGREIHKHRIFPRSPFYVLFLMRVTDYLQNRLFFLINDQDLFSARKYGSLRPQTIVLFI